MRILEDDDIFIFGTAKSDVIVASGQAGYYSLYGQTFYGMEIMGGRGNDDINPGIMQNPTSIAMIFGGMNLHDTRLPDRFDIRTPLENSGNDTLHFGAGIWADGGDGHDANFSHGPSSKGAFMPRVWMDSAMDILSVDNTDKSRDIKVGASIDGTDFARDGSGFYNGFQLDNIHFARIFTSKAGYTYAEVNGFGIHSLSKVPAIRSQYNDVLLYDKGDDPNHHEFYVRVDEGETARQAVTEEVHKDAMPGPDQWLF